MTESAPTTETSVPSEPVAVSDAAQTEQRSSEAKDTSPNLWQRLFGAHPKASGESETSTQDASSAEQPSPKTLSIPEDELERRIQAETDRREAKRQKDAIAKAEQERRQAVERKLDPSSPEYDPYAGTEERARLQAETQAQEGFQSLLANVGKHYDEATLDVVVQQVPPAERERIFKLEGAGVGLNGRKLIMAESLKALEKHWKSEGAREAESKLRESPIFRKKVFAEHRGTVEEPELLPAGSGNGKDDFMENIFADYKRAKGRA